MALKLVYHFQASENVNDEFIPASYGVVFFFSNEGFLDNDFLSEISKSVPGANHENLFFMSLDDLKLFSIKVCQELSENEVRLISVQDYNIGIDGAKELNSFQKIFEKYGELIMNDSFRKKGLIAKLFKS
jgi:hypothetical protein